MIAIIDYGMGNIFSMFNGVRAAGGNAKVISDPKGLDDADGIIIPGVGSFGDGVRSISPFIPGILRICESTPILGVCLGMQMMFERSEEGDVGGIGIVKGDVKLLPKNVRIPQMGWNSVIMEDDEIFDGIQNGSYFYFAHSYRCIPVEDVTIATVEYGEKIVAAIRKGCIYGVQFHPEKSGKVGIKMLENFVKICRR